jgi:hypothetical protein
MAFIAFIAFIAFMGAIFQAKMGKLPRVRGEFQGGLSGSDGKSFQQDPCDCLFALRICV